MDERELQEQGFSLDDIMREFGSGEPLPEPVDYLNYPKAEPEEAPEEEPASADLDATRRADGDFVKQVQQAEEEAAPEEAEEEAQPDEPAAEEPPQEAFAAQWEPEYEQPIGEYVPPEPIPFNPRSRRMEMKRKLVEGPEREYYALVEQGTGRLLAAVFLNFLVLLLSASVIAMQVSGVIPPERMRLVVFSQVFAFLFSALLGSYQLMDGIAALFHGRFTPDTLLFTAFAACGADACFCLREERIPLCAAFSLAVTLSLIGELQRRQTKLGQLDTMRRASRLDSIVKTPDYYEGKPAFQRAEGQVEDFTETYTQPARPERVVSWYILAAALCSIALAVFAGVWTGSVSRGLQTWGAATLVAMPVTGFIAVSCPTAILEKRLHRHGVVLCGWQGVEGFRFPAVIPLKDSDLFPSGSIRLNGVKFFGDLAPDLVVSCAAALAGAEDGELASIFDQLVESRNGYHLSAENMQTYSGGGIGGEVDGLPVLMGTLSFLQEMGVEVPEGTRVNQAVYVAVDGMLGGVFAISFHKSRAVAMGLSCLCGYRKLTPILISNDFMLTESFIRSKFSVNVRRMRFPDKALRRELAQKQPDPQSAALALTTKEDLAATAFAITGSRALRRSCGFGVGITVFGGIVGLVTVLVLTVCGATHLLTPENMLLFTLAWSLPGLLAAQWTRRV